MILRVLFLLLSVKLTCPNSIGPNWQVADDPLVILHVNELIKSAKRIIHDTDEQIDRTQHLRLNSIRSIPYEVGYIMYNIQDEYRRMVDKYNTCYTMGGRLYIHEFMFYLEDVEYHFWKIEHLANMLHEVERKYRMRGNTLYKPYNDLWLNEHNPKFESVDNDDLTTKKKRDKKKSKYSKKNVTSASDFVGGYMTTTTRRKGTLWPLEYGWEPKLVFWW